MITRDELHSLNAESRRWLAELAREPLPLRAGRHTSWELGVLVERGLAFRSHYAVTITPLGLDTLERVA